MFARILKHNPYHDAGGKFTDSESATFVSTSGVFAARRSAGSGVDSRDYTHVTDLEEFAGDQHAAIADLRDSDEAAVQALQNYTSSDFREINSYLREGDASYYDREDAVKDIDRVFDAVGPIGQDLIAYRGIKGNTGKKIQDAIDNGTLKGSTLTDKGYTSTSVSKSVADNWGGVLVNLRVPKESRGAYVGESDFGKSDGFSVFPNERELVLERGGTMRFVDGRVEAGKYVVDAIWEPEKRK